MRCVPARDFSIAKALLWKGAIFDDPPYQRGSGVWPLEKEQLFIDSLLNGFDVPKFYLHDLRGRHPNRVYAVVDGKQRLNAIWRFLADEFALAGDFRVERANAPELPRGIPPPRPGALLSEFHPRWQQLLRSTHLAVVLIQNSTEADIDDLFARLNSGEPLNAAERRNARGGAMVALIRAVARRPFFAERLATPRSRYKHLDLAARLLCIERATGDGEGPIPDLRGPALDSFVETNRRLAPPARRALVARVDARLALLGRGFRRADPLLARDAAVPIAYLFVRTAAMAGRNPSGVRDVLDRFEMRRRAAFPQPVRSGASKGGSDAAFLEYSHLVRSAPYSPRSLARRLAILTEALRAEQGVAT